MADWETYSFKPSAGCRLSSVYHVVHLPVARRILEDGALRAGLIADESKLNRSRTCVTWLSANTWANGSIYGNVQFAFDWADIIDGLQVYWVEAMTGYSPAAYRFLLTDREMSMSKHVKPYDPTIDEGPLVRRGGEWFWNDAYTSEFMIEADISLDTCKDVRFIRHHPKICRSGRSKCEYKAFSETKTGGCILALLLGSSLNSADHAFLREREDGTRRLTASAEDGITGIFFALGKRKNWFNGSISRPESCLSVLRGALALHGSGQYEAAKELASLLQSQELFERTLEVIIEEHFEMPGYQLPD